MSKVVAEEIAGEDEPEAVAIPPVSNPRNSAMDEIAEAARRHRDKEMEADKLIVAEEPAPAEVEKLGKLEEPAEVENVDISPEPANNLIIERDGQQFIQLNVNGQSQELSLEEARSKLQQGENANLQTKLAVEKQQAADLVKADYEARLANDSTQPDDNSASQAETKLRVKDALQKLYDEGDVEGSADIIVEALQRTPAQPVQSISEADVDTIIDRRENRKALGDAFKQFTADERFTSLVGDEDLMSLVDKKTARLQNDAEFMGTSPSYFDIFTKAGEQVLNQFSATPRGESEKPDTVMERKRKQPAAVTSRTARRTAPEPVKPKTTNDVIAEIAKSRGQTGY